MSWVVRGEPTYSTVYRMPLVAASVAALINTMVADDLPIGIRSADKHMAISRNPWITNSEHVLNLPSSWGTLHELTKFDDDEWEDGLASGDISPELTKAKAGQIRRRRGSLSNQ